MTILFKEEMKSKKQRNVCHISIIITKTQKLEGEDADFPERKEWMQH